MVKNGFKYTDGTPYCDYSITFRFGKSYFGTEQREKIQAKNPKDNPRISRISRTTHENPGFPGRVRTLKQCLQESGFDSPRFTEMYSSEEDRRY